MNFRDMDIDQAAPTSKVCSREKGIAAEDLGTSVSM